MQYVHYVDEMPAVLADLSNRLHVLSGTNTDSGRATKEAEFEGIAEFEVERDTLFDVLTECRVVSALNLSRPVGCSGMDQGAFTPAAGCAFCSQLSAVRWTLQTKIPEEVAIQQYCNDIASSAHVEVMRYAKVSAPPALADCGLPV